MPSPVDSVGLVVTAKHWPTPPVASTVFVAANVSTAPFGPSARDAATDARLDEQLQCEPAFADFDGGGLDRGNERALDLGTGRVAARVHDARE